MSEPRAFGMVLHPWGAGVVDRWVRWAVEAPHALTSFALARIVFGLILAAELIRNTIDRHYLWGSGADWGSAAAEESTPLILRFLFADGSGPLFELEYALLGVLVVLFLLGWRTRVVTPLIVLFWESLMAQNPFLLNSGDTAMRITLFFLMFADLSARLSLDARRRRIRGRDRPPRWGITLLHNTALVLCIVQLLVIYLLSSWFKFHSVAWLSGIAVHYPLGLASYSPFPGLSGFVAEHAILVVGFTVASFAAQAVFPFCLLWRPSRVVILVIVTGMHLGVAVLMGLWTFSLTMIALDVLLIRDRSWAGLVSRAPTTVDPWSPPSIVAIARRRSPS